MYEIKIECAPIPWKAHGGWGNHAYNPRHDEKLFYQLHIKNQYPENFPIATAVRTEYLFLMGIPSSYTKKKREYMLNDHVEHIKRPDTSNLVKFAEDCLKGIVFKDDSQVVEIHARKIYALIPSTIIKIFLK
jgi:Holliday junction resolvase RusA-like endonuclease